LLGVDVVRNKKLLASDVTARHLLDLIDGRRAKIVVTAIGGQGHILGRGNQQISPEIIRQVGRENLMIIATKEKLVSLGGRPLLVDTGDAALDQKLSGYTRIITGYGDYVIYKVGY
jgi:predicted polyphosphate/ATP-dependent NAD kinase